MTPSYPITFVQGRFKGGFDSEHEMTYNIRRYLLSDCQEKSLKDAGLTIEDCLNGRFGDSHEGMVLSMFAAWNEKLGFKCFGF